LSAKSLSTEYKKKESNTYAIDEEYDHFISKVSAVVNVSAKFLLI
jgi:hypothetical protein